MVGTAFRPKVERCFPSVDVVVDLFCNHGIVGRAVETVASAAVFMGAMIFYGELGVVGSAQESPGSHGLGLELCNFGESVAVVVVAVA